MAKLLKTFDTENDKFLEAVHHNQMSTYSWAFLLGNAALKELSKQQKAARAVNDHSPLPLSFTIGRHIRVANFASKNVEIAWNKNLQKQ